MSVSTYNWKIPLLRRRMVLTDDLCKARNGHRHICRPQTLALWFDGRHGPQSLFSCRPQIHLVLFCLGKIEVAGVVSLDNGLNRKDVAFDALCWT